MRSSLVKIERFHWWPGIVNNMDYKKLSMFHSLSWTKRLPPQFARDLSEFYIDYRELIVYVFKI